MGQAGLFPSKQTQDRTCAHTGQQGLMGHTQLLRAASWGQGSWRQAPLLPNTGHRSKTMQCFCGGQWAHQGPTVQPGR